jgi:hypothetical protein
MIHQINSHLNNYNLDIREIGDARFMDQKVTPDVLCIIADCIIQFTKDDTDKEFTTRDIWESEYANENVKDIFNKPDVLDNTARSEYDKFFAQPLRMLAYAGVLNLEKRGNRNIFKVNNLNLLTYISIKEKNALTFITLYLEKVLNDSDIWNIFEDFFNNNDRTHFNTLKHEYEEFIIANTPINGTTEVRRIFTKIINPLSYIRKKHGTKGGNFSPDVIGYDELMYNRRNWRDVVKLRGETRQVYEERAQLLVSNTHRAFARFTMEKAKRLIRERYQDVSEVQDELAAGQATQVHHIFPRNDYPEIETYLENLILLTGSQHSAKAHPNNNTRFIDKEYQLLCLLTKNQSIKESVELLQDGFYSKDDFVYVLNTGIQNGHEFDVDDTFETIEDQITYAYHKN